MILVVIGHMPINNTLKIYLYSFHLPLFFMISGIAYGLSSNKESLGEYVKKMFKRLIIPYFLLNLLFAPLWYINSVVLAKQDITILDPILGTLFSNQLWKGLFSNVTWFLPALFIISITFKAIDTSVSSYRSKSFLVVLIASIGVILSIFDIRLILPWHFQTCFIALSFYYLGYLYIINKEHIDKFINEKVNSNIVQSLFLIGLLIIGYLLGIYNNKISMHANNYQNILIFYVSALITCFSVINLIKKTKESPLLKFIGINTLVYMTAHCPIMRFFRYLSSYSNTFLNNYPIASGIIIMVLIIPLVFFINRFLPFIVGKKRHNYKKS